jgi:tetraacyldisaccharide 4'-kinase
MRPRWLTRRDESRLGRVALAPLVPAAWVYAGIVAAHRRLYEQGVLARRRIPGHVVSVGNLGVGGTGKTPFAAWLASGLHARGRKVVLASRGYGGRSEEPVQVVSDGRFVRGRAEAAGDEPMVLAAHAPGVPVLVGRDRGIVGLRAHAVFGADVLVLDDGFQHHRLERDLDLVLFDGRLGLGNRHILPRGPLRECPAGLRRADAIGVIDGPLPPEDEEVLARRAPRAFRFAARRRPAGLRPLRGGPSAEADTLAGSDVGLLAALAGPASFRRTLESLGARVTAERIFRDHHRYRQADLEDLADETPVWVTTEKDAVKILPTWVGRAEVYVLSIDLDVDAGDALLDWVESRLR